MFSNVGAEFSLVNPKVTNYIVTMEKRRKRRRSIRDWPIMPTIAIDPVIWQLVQESRHLDGHPNLAEAVRDLIEAGLRQKGRLPPPKT